MPIPAKTVTFSTTLLATANTEYTIVLPKGTKQLEVFTNTSGASLRVAYDTGKVAGPTEPYYPIVPGRTYYEQELLLDAPKNLYVASTVNSTNLNVKIWS